MAARKASVGSTRKSAKRKVARKAAPKAVASQKKLPSIKDPLNKSGIIRALTDMNGTSRSCNRSLDLGIDKRASLARMRVSSPHPTRRPDGLSGAPPW